MVHDSIRVDRADGVMPALMTTHEVAAWLKTTISAVYAKAERGTLLEPYVSAGASTSSARSC